MTKLSVRLLAASAAIIFIISVLAAAENRGDSAVYRLYNPNSGEHLLTRDCTEKTRLSQGGGFNYEGVAFYVADRQGRRLRPLHRLYLASGMHLYTIDQQEVSNLQYQPGNRYEAVVGYIADRPQRNTVPLYRLYNGTSHFFTTNEQEKNDYLNQPGARMEGILGYVWTTGSSNPCDSYATGPGYPYPPTGPLPPVYPPQGRGYPAMYSQSNYTGTSLSLDRDWAGSNDWNSRNNRVRSIRVPFGWTVTVYDKTNFRGRSQIITGNWSPQPNDSWYGKVRSIRVLRGQQRFPQ